MTAKSLTETANDIRKVADDENRWLLNEAADCLEAADGLVEIERIKSRGVFRVIRERKLRALRGTK